MSCCGATVSVPTEAQNSNARFEQLARERLTASSIEIGNDKYKTGFVVPEMHCAGCIRTIERGLADLAPVEHVRANLSNKTVSVIWSKAEGDGLAISRELDRLGFEHHLEYDEGSEKSGDPANKSLLIALAVAGFAAANIMLLSVSVWSGADQETAKLFHLISGLIAVPAVAYSGQPFFRSALRALSARRLNMDVPISLAVLLALGMSIYESLTGGDEAYFDASVMLLFFLLIGRYLDQLMRHKALGAVERLHSLSAKDGILVCANGEVSNIPLKDINPGMRLRVFPGERFPVNGQIIDGISDLDRSHVTGESTPVVGNTGDLIEAGTLNLTGPLEIEAATGAENSFLGEIKRMMEAAENGRGAYIRIADRMAQIYAPAVHLLALITFIAWIILTSGDWHASLYTAIAVLIITCPCALGLAVPVAHVIGANRLMKGGVLMRDGTALERLSEVDTAVFDKTGTLTTDTASVVSIKGGDEVTLPLIKSLADKSGHPSARAVSTMFKDLEGAEIHSLQEYPGLGVEGTSNGNTVRFGKPEWVAEIASGKSENLAPYSISFTERGKSPTHFITQDDLREGAGSAVYRLMKAGIACEILSGDRADKVLKIARELNISCFASNQVPAEKITRVKFLQEEGRKVLMVGDGINDAPALAAGNVSMVPASASDVGRHSADFVFIRESLAAVPFALDVARISARVVRQNFGIAIAYNCVAVPLAMAGFVTPLIAAIAMSASSVVVVANSFRINFANAGTNELSSRKREENFTQQTEFAS